VIGVLYSILAGFLIGIQNVFNTRLGEKLGSWGTILLIHFLGLIASIIVFTLNKESFKALLSGLGNVNKLYVIGGFFGVVILFGVMKGVTILGATSAVAILLTAQLLISLIIDTFGLFGMEKVQFVITKPLGIIVMIIGIILIKS